MPRVIHFEFAADNPERAAKFYREVFGWESTKVGRPHGLLAGENRLRRPGH
ncbi:MAG: hypothetical protein JWM83_1416 [Candidatus Angelobacter sp.]|nr:hypothetical protein [Candidatus Angelobacter sp.]